MGNENGVQTSPDFEHAMDVEEVVSASNWPSLCQREQGRLIKFLLSIKPDSSTCNRNAHKAFSLPFSDFEKKSYSFGVLHWRVRVIMLCSPNTSLQ